MPTVCTLTRAILRYPFGSMALTSVLPTAYHEIPTPKSSPIVVVWTFALQAEAGMCIMCRFVRFLKLAAPTLALICTMNCARDQTHRLRVAINAGDEGHAIASLSKQYSSA